MKKLLFIILTLTCITAKSQINTWLITQTGQAEYDSARVFTADSNIAYITPSTLDDSTAALRADFPATPSLYYQKVQSNYSPQTQRGYLNFGSTFTVTDELINNSTNISVYSSPKLATARKIQGVSFDGTANIDPINGTGFVKATGTSLSYDNSTYLTTAAAASGYQPLDADLTTISTLTATTDNFIVSVGSAWASRTPAEVKTTLAIANTDVSGLGTLSTQNGTFSGTSSGTNTGDNASNTTSNTYADGKVADAINDATTAIAPSQNAVFDALALKANLASPTLTGTVTATNTTDITLGAESALRVGGAANSTNITMGEYNSALGIQARNNGAAANLFLQGDGGGVAVGNGALTGQRILAVNNTGTGTGDYSAVEIRTGSAGTDALRQYVLGPSFITSGSNFQDGAAITTGTGLSGGFSIGTLASASLRFYTNNILRTTIDASGHTIHTARVQLSKGANVASAGDLTLGSAGNAFSITGTTTINTITTTNWQSGSVIILIFAASLTVKNNTAGGASTAKMLLNGGVDFSATANDVLTLIYDGTNWLECSRSIN